MRLLVDAQCVQSSSSLRGIGRFALSLTRALVETTGEHQVEVLLNGGDDPARLMRARLALETFLPPGRIHVFDAAWPWSGPVDDRRRSAAEAAYTAAVRSLRPDVLLVGSVFEGDGENVLSLPGTIDDPPCAAVLYDLIPALDPGQYLLGPGADVYWRRFEALRGCDHLLAISRHSGSQAQQLLGERCPPVTPIWGGPYPSGDFPAFEQQHDDGPVAVPRQYVLSVGGDHPRKNLDLLVRAWGRVREDLRQATPLVLACRLNPGTVRRLRRVARRAGVAPEQLVLTGGVSEATLHRLYREATAFVFPSIEEGLGMPPLEAVAAGCPTLLAWGSSLSELSEDPASFFDGHNADDLAAALERVLASPQAREALVRAGAVTAERFTWQHAAQLAWGALETLDGYRPRPLPDADVPAPVPLSDARGVEGTLAVPGPVLLDVPLPVDQGQGVLGLPRTPRRLLAGATALVVTSDVAASAAVGAGLLEAPVLSPQQVPRLVEHDFLEQLALALAPLRLADDTSARVIDAASNPPRWTLERPRPVWLLLHATDVCADVVLSCAGAGVDLVVARGSAAGLARLVDVALVAQEVVEDQIELLAQARRAGAPVVVLRPAGAAPVELPGWCHVEQLPGAVGDVDSWQALAPVLAARWGRTTGWPWHPSG